MIVKSVEPVASVVFATKDEYTEWLQELNDINSNSYAVDSKKKKLDYKLEGSLLELVNIDVAIDNIYVEYLYITLDGNLVKGNKLDELLNILAFQHFGIEKDKSILHYVFWHNVTGSINEYMLYRLWVEK